MLATLKKWLGFAEKTKADESIATCYRSLGDIPNTLDLQDKTIVVCRAGNLTLRKEKELPDRLEANELCWILPGNDLPLTLNFQFGPFQIHAEIVIRFEADSAFVRYATTLTASGQDRITQESLALFVAGQWVDLLSLQGIEPDRFRDADASELSSFRTHLSLLLQESGFRCIALKSISVSGINPPVEPDEPLPPEASEELRDAVAGANSQQNWDQLLDQLDEAGFQPSAVEAERLESLGSEYRDKNISSDETALQIQKMIRRKNLEIDLIAEDVARWNAAETKLRLLDALDDQSEEFLLQTIGQAEKLAKVPSTWYLLRRQKVDEKLRQYLKKSASQLNTRLESVMQRQTNLAAKSKFVRAQATLKRISDKIAMTPSLSAGGAGFKQKRRSYDELIETLRRSITAVQLTDGILSTLLSEDYSQPERDKLVTDLESTLQTLENEIHQRKNIYST